MRLFKESETRYPRLFVAVASLGASYLGPLQNDLELLHFFFSMLILLGSSTFYPNMLVVYYTISLIKMSFFSSFRYVVLNTRKPDRARYANTSNKQKI